MDKLLERRVEEGSLKLLIFNMMFDTLFDVPCLDTACSSRYNGSQRRIGVSGLLEEKDLLAIAQLMDFKLAQQKQEMILRWLSKRKKSSVRPWY